MKKIFYLPTLIVLVSLIHTNTSIAAAVTLPWSSTFKCTDWTQSDGLYSPQFDCDDMSGFLGNKCDNGDGTTEEDQITVAADNLTGGRGKGARHWVGDGYNNNAGGFRIPFSTLQSELWFRWYMRYEAGFAWDPLNFQKIVYMRNGVNRPYVGWEKWDHLTMIDGSTAHHGNTQSVGYGWDNIMSSGANDANGHKTSDGKWHYYEIHLKMDTDGTDGVGEMWIDGIQIMSTNNADWGTSNWDAIAIPSNQNFPANNRCAYMDIDDLAISTTGYIGPLASGLDTTPPVVSNGSPTGSLASGTTQTTLSVTTDENAYCGYSTSSGTSYASMTTFTTTGGVGHSEIITGLSDGSAYNYYVRCEDKSSNVNTSDYPITFSVSSAGSGDTTPPVISGGSPTGTLASGTTQTTLSVTTDENATCGYSTSSGTAYASMTPFTITGGVTGHSETITGLSDGSIYNYYVRCEDSIPNANLNDYTITFSVSSGGGSPQTMTFYPTSADGYMYSSSSTSFDIAHDATAGTSVDSTSVNSRVSAGESSNSLARAFFSFDTSALPDNAVITDADLNLYVYQMNNNDDDGDDWINVVQGNQNSPTSLIADDFDQAGAINNPVEGAARVDITSITTGQYTAWILDATGLSWISKTGHTMLALREGHDALDSPPTSYNRIKFYASEQTGTAQDPYLSITYTSGSTAPAAPTGLRIVP